MIRHDDAFFNKVMEQMGGDPNPDFIDPITKKVMRDPVMVSSGIVYDRSSACLANGTVKF